jgi:hypothetical protein
VADIRVQLARRAGDPRAVVAALRPLAHLSLAHGAWLGEAQLDLGRYEAAMATFLRSGNWMDAAWVAERVVTPEELARAIPRMPGRGEDRPAGEPHRPVGFWSSFDESELPLEGAEPTCFSVEDRQRRAEVTRLNLHLVLARRLARMGRWDEAVPHFARVADRATPDAGLGPVAVRSRAAAAAWRARAQAVTPGERASATLAFLDAVIPARFALLATEGFPDYGAYNGAYTEGNNDLAEYRLTTGRAGADERRRILASVAERFVEGRVEDLAAPSDPLRVALGESSSWEGVPHRRRYHFLWPLAELAWTSAAGLERGDPALVQLLCRGGWLLRNRQPDVADVYYKRLVWQGRPDPVAQVADALRWFPDVDAETGACLAKPWPPPPPRLNARQRRAREAQRAEWDALRDATRTEMEAREAAILAQRTWMSAVFRYVAVGMALLLLTARWGRPGRSG